MTFPRERGFSVRRVPSCATFFSRYDNRKVNRQKNFFVCHIARQIAELEREVANLRENGKSEGVVETALAPNARRDAQVSAVAQTECSLVKSEEVLAHLRGELAQSKVRASALKKCFV